MKTNFKLLADCKELIAEITGWVMEEWGDEGLSEDLVRAEFVSFSNRTTVPITLVAFSGDVPVGIASIKLREMAILQDKPYWFGGLLVKREHRRKGYGTELLKQTTDLASSLGIKELYLQTRSPNFYEPISKFRNGSAAGETGGITRRFE